MTTVERPLGRHRRHRRHLGPEPPPRRARRVRRRRPARRGRPPGHGARAERGRIGGFDADDLVRFMSRTAELHDRLGRAGSYAGAPLRHRRDRPGQRRPACSGSRSGRPPSPPSCSSSTSSGRRSTTTGSSELLADDRLAFCRHHLESARRYRPHLLSEPEERVLAEKAGHRARRPGAGCSASSPRPSRSSLDGETATLEDGLSRLQSHPTPRCAGAAAEAVTDGLAPGLRTRAFIFNTLLLDKADRRPPAGLPDLALVAATWPTRPATSRSQALVEAVRGPLRHPAALVRAQGRASSASTGSPTTTAAPAWPPSDVAHRLGRGQGARARRLRLVLARAGRHRPPLLRRALDRRARPARASARAPSAPTPCPSVHPYVLLNWTRPQPRRAHPGPRARPRPARLPGPRAGRLPPEHAADPGRDGVGVRRDGRRSTGCSSRRRPGRPARAAGREHRGRHRHRLPPDGHEPLRGRSCTPRAATEGELSVERFGDLWAESQTEMLGDAVEITEGYRTWWSYIPHFIGTPGYVYAYAYGQLLALSVYRQYEEQGSDFVPRYLHLLVGRRVDGARGPRPHRRAATSPTPASGTAGLDIVEEQLDGRGGGRRRDAAHDRRRRPASALTAVVVHRDRQRRRRAWGPAAPCWRRASTGSSWSTTAPRRASLARVRAGLPEAEVLALGAQHRLRSRRQRRPAAVARPRTPPRPGRGCSLCPHDAAPRAGLRRPAPAPPPRARPGAGLACAEYGDGESAWPDRSSTGTSVGSSARPTARPGLGGRRPPPRHPARSPARACLDDIGLFDESLLRLLRGGRPRHPGRGRRLGGRHRAGGRWCRVPLFDPGDGVAVAVQG